MKSPKFFLVIVISSISLGLVLDSQAGPQSAQAGSNYGGTIPEAEPTLLLHEAIEKFDPAKNKMQKISGTVNKVCRRRGCWMILSDANLHARVTFKDYKFFVPTDTYNQRSVVYGVLTENILSEELAKHYAEDAGRSDAAIQGSQKEYSIVAEAVYLENAVKK